MCASSKTIDDLIKSTQTQKKLELEPDPFIHPPQSDMQIEASMGKKDAQAPNHKLLWLRPG